MQSILIPSDISVFISRSLEKTTTFIKRQGPRGIFIKKGGEFILSKLQTSEGPRIFVSGVFPQQESIILAQLWKQAQGLSLGYRKRLRLVGMGFRGVVQKNSTIFEAKNVKRIIYPKHRIRQENCGGLKESGEKSTLLLKLGYSHECGFPLEMLKEKNIAVDISRLEGRSKGTIISVNGSSPVGISSVISEIQNFRLPDIYKGKGIHKYGIKLVLKKGKRQG